jgi:hypothetical protein
MLGVKKKFKVDFLEQENNIFINKLNYVCRHYDNTHKLCKQNTETIGDYKVMLEDLDIIIRDIREETRFNKKRIDSIESTLPKMIRELIDFYIEQKL